MLVSSHVLAEVAQTVDQVLIISRGRLVIESSLAELTARVGGTVRVRSADPEQLADGAAREHLQARRGTEQALLVHGAYERAGRARSPSRLASRFTSW